MHMCMLHVHVQYVHVTPPHTAVGAMVTQWRAPRPTDRLPSLRVSGLVKSSLNSVITRSSAWCSVLAMQARHVQLGLLFGCRLVQTMMRLALGPIVVYVCEDEAMECTASTRASLLSAFSLGYILTQVAGGALADVIGPSNVILLAMILAALCTFASGAAPTVEMLWLAQVITGIAQGPLFPTSVSYLSRWLPSQERAIGATLLDAGTTAGSLVALPFSGRLAAALGWRWTLHAWGVATLVFAVVWRALSAESPAQCSYITREENTYLAATIPAVQKPSAVEGRGGRRAAVARLFCRTPLWAIFVAHGAFNFVTQFVHAWSSLFYGEVLGLRPEHATLPLMVPPLVDLSVKVFGAAPLGRCMRARGYSILGCRRAFSTIGFVGTAAALLAVPACARAGGAPLATLAFSVALGASALHPSGFKANYLDVVSPASAGLVSGVGNTLASGASWAAPQVVGAMLAGHSKGSADGWSAVMLCMAAVSLGAAAVFATLSSATPLDQPEETPARTPAVPTEAKRAEAYPVGPPLAAEAAGEAAGKRGDEREGGSEMRRRRRIAANPEGKGAAALAASPLVHA